MIAINEDILSCFYVKDYYNSTIFYDCHNLRHYFLVIRMTITQVTVENGRLKI